MGQNLFIASHCGTKYTRLMYPPVGCECSDTCCDCEKNISCRDVDGNPQRESQKYCSAGEEMQVTSSSSGMTPAWYGWTGDPEDEPYFSYGPWNRNLWYRNIDVYSSYSVSYSYTEDATLDQGSIANYYISNVASTERYVITCPLGLLGEIDAYEHDYVSTREHDYWKSRKGVTGWKSTILGEYSDNTICQIFGLDMIIQSHNWPCGQSFMKECWYPDHCDSVLDEETESSELFASCKTGVNASKTDPRVLGRNGSFEAAVRIGIEAVKALAPDPAPGELKSFNVSMDILRTPLNP